MVVELDELFARMKPIAELDSVTGPGVYAFALLEGASLRDVEAAKDGLIYVGMTDQCLEVRNHFVHAHSGFSTFRRSLGAILKNELGLKAYRRSSGASPSNTRNYRFSDDGERALTEWMKQSLRLAQLGSEEGVGETEGYLIDLLEPPLNLKGWRNPQAQLIKRLRADCAAEAERNGVYKN